MPSHNTYRLTWVSLTLDEGYLLKASPPNLERGVAPLGHSAPTQLLLLERGVAPPFCHPDLGRGSSSWSPPLTSGELPFYIPLWDTLINPPF